MNKIFEELLFSHEEIVARCKELGQEITKDYEGKTPLVVGMLKGSIPFMAELIKHIDCDMETEYMQCSSYEGTESTHNVVVKKDLSVSIEGRHVIVVEDIVDTGLTLKLVMGLLKDRKPASLEIVSLLNKQARRIVDGLEVKYLGFEVENKFVVGFGLDYDGLYRNIDEIGVLKKEIYMK